MNRLDRSAWHMQGHSRLRRGEPCLGWGWSHWHGLGGGGCDRGCREGRAGDGGPGEQGGRRCTRTTDAGRPEEARPCGGACGASGRRSDGGGWQGGWVWDFVQREEPNTQQHKTRNACEHHSLLAFDGAQREGYVRPRRWMAVYRQRCGVRIGGHARCIAVIWCNGCANRRERRRRRHEVF